MRYSKGPYQGNLLLPFLQNKALDFVNSTLYKAGQSSSSLIQNNKTLQKQITKLELRATARKPLLVDSQTLKEAIKAIIMKNKSQYTTEFINAATQVSQVGQISFRSTVQTKQIILRFLTGESLPLSFSIQSVICWNKEISEMHVNEIFDQGNSSEFHAFGIMADESTRGQKNFFIICLIFCNYKNNAPDFQLIEMKNLDNCTGKSVAQAIYNTFEINSHQCLTFVSDNTNYMSNKIGGAVALFNKLTGEICFGKLPSISGLSQKKLPENLLYLTLEIHDSYNKSNKETPMGINSDHIRMLYQERIQYKLPKYQQPLRTRWLYELTCAEQYTPDILRSFLVLLNNF
ncbi:8791_t:CDS:2 [Funneliformis mosseae]|uniref:8791_t:CDS:1 n=1 Tax=Funneliformis mosseae TaxID=27381 RepID=A0A9N9H0Q2_FUNMO|nr:8791_t:CDS:2 [Funneliformis mosseae]